MHNTSKYSISIIIIFISLISNVSGSSSIEARETLSKYIEAVRNEQWIKAAQFWHNTDIERSENLDIKFKEIEAKYDCASPLIFAHGKAFGNSQQIQINLSEDQGLKKKYDIVLYYSSIDSQSFAYYLKKLDNKWSICSSLEYYDIPWQIVKTEFYRVYYTDESMINSVALNYLDSFAQALLDRFEVNKANIEKIKTAKIDYYFCNEYQIQLLTGHDAQGMTSLPYDAIITQHIPHTHEITHLLINYALRETSLFTLPLLQEGLACSQGGRWGKSADIISYRGAACLKFDLFSLEDILTNSGFYNCQAGLDGAYAVSSLFSKMIIEKHGMDKFKQLYLTFSGNMQSINSFSSESIKQTLEEILGTSWDEFAAEFKAFASDQEKTGLTPGGEAGKESPIINYNTEDISYSVSNSDNTNCFFSIEIPGGFQKAVMLLKENNNNIPDIYRSWQFDLYNTNLQFDSFEYGIQFSPDEIGVYDYLTNQVTAKHVQGFFPSDNYYDEEENTITFSLDKSLLRNPLGEYNISIHIVE